MTAEAMGSAVEDADAAMAPLPTNGRPPKDDRPRHGEIGGQSAGSAVAEAMRVPAADAASARMLSPPSWTPSRRVVWVEEPISAGGRRLRQAGASSKPGPAPCAPAETRKSAPGLVLCGSGTCRWHNANATGFAVIHPRTCSIRHRWPLSQAAQHQAGLDRFIRGDRQCRSTTCAAYS
jgi:hypothetical protein